MSAPIDPNTQLNDVYIFEQKLRESLIQAHRERKIYQFLLFVICSTFLISSINLVYSFINQREVSLFEYLYVILTSGFLFMFWMLGLYNDKIAYAKKYLPRCNAALRSFNISYNMDSGKLVLLKRTKKKV
eukprot:TRINITY_DN15874_c0_g1_i1.p1 TRINITY_DN15874_c0_g1~~TRINITY_DN15874_c0_g1_i1.p1  ORF type:complete len:130 (-),score=20.36 TRINITY_DN15874_c0_g1_i1:93-482(-)